MDLESIQYYEESPEEKGRRKKSEEQFSMGVQGILKLLGTLLFVSFIYSSSLFAAYFIFRGTSFFAGLQSWEKVIAVLVLAYLISSLVFFLKGIMMALKAGRKWGWIFIWLVCFVYVCLLPSVAIYFILESMLGPSIPEKADGISHYKFWSLAGAVIAGSIIYYKYGLSRDSALKVSYWAYTLGKNTGIALLRRNK
jgi:hypothetical protein